MSCRSRFDHAADPQHSPLAPFEILGFEPFGRRIPSGPSYPLALDTFQFEGERRGLRGEDMAYFAIVNESGPAWNLSRSRRNQEGWDEHAAYIDGLAREGFFLMVGPLSPTKSLLIVEADDEQVVKTRLAEDPWRKTGILRVFSIEPWEVLVGRERLVSPQG